MLYKVLYNCVDFGPYLPHWVHPQPQEQRLLSSAQAMAQNECPICVDTMSDVPAVMPCAGKHTACYGCIREWRVTCVLNAVEFSCPMCRLRGKRASVIAIP